MPAHSPRRQRPIFWGWYIVGATFFIGIIGGGFFGTALGAFFLALKEEFSQGSSGKLSFVLGLASVEGAIVGPIQGYLIDRFGPRPISIAGMLMLGGGWILASMANSLGVFVVFFLMMAMGNGMGLVAAPLACIASWFEGKRGMAFAIGSAGFGLGSVVVPLDSFLVDEFGWRGAARTAGILILALGLPLAMLFRRRPEDYGLLPDGAAARPASAAKADAQGYAETDLTTREALASKSFTMRSMVISGVTVHFIAAMVDRDMAKSTAASLFALAGVMSLPGRIGVGLLTDRFEKRLVNSGVVLGLAGAMLLGAWAGNVWQAVLFLLAYGVTTGGGGSAMFAIRGEYFGRRAFATISGFGTAFQAGGAMLGNVLAGVTYDVTDSYTVAFVAFAALSGAAAVSIFLARRPVPRRLRGRVA
jgi:MFS family permease